MRRRQRIPGTRGTLFVLAQIRDDDSTERKNALALRNRCATEGKCPACGVIGELVPDPEVERLYHLIFRHEDSCPVLRDDEAA
jgi:hypothetical protein